MCFYFPVEFFSRIYFCPVRLNWFRLLTWFLFLYLLGLCLLSCASSIHLNILNYRFFYNILSLSLFIFYRNSSSPICTKFSISLLILHFISLKTLSKCYNSNEEVFLFNFLYAISSFICSWFLSKSCSRHVFVSLHF